MPATSVLLESSAAVPRERAFDVIAPVDLTLIFGGLGPIPAVIGTRAQTGAWDHVGAERIVCLADGSEARERITAHQPPCHFAYRVGPFGGLLGRIVRHADGAWWFGSAGTIRWRYEFQPQPGMRPLVSAVLVPLWRAYARRVLAAAVALTA
ncbi:MAG: SRPBCC family protein [Solirubrobacteraceae bacterium]